MASPQIAHNPDVYDELNVHQNDKLNKIVSADETIYFSGEVVRTKKILASKRRILIITNRFLYYIRPDTGSFLTKITHKKDASSGLLKRRMDSDRIEALSLTISPTSADKFKIHIEGEDCFTFDSNGKKEKIIKAIERVYYENHNYYLAVCLYADSQPETERLEENLNKKSAEDFRMFSDNWQKDLFFVIEHNALNPEAGNMYQIIPFSGHVVDTNESTSNTQLEKQEPRVSYISDPKALKQLKTIKKIEDIVMTTSVIVKKPVKPFAF